MAELGRRKAKTLGSILALTCGAALLAACSSGPSQVASGKPKRSKEYFAESEYGVKASPRVSHLATNLPRGGGRDQVGRPYQVRGKWYTPKEDPNYRSAGLASWYGDAFHGRLTANGEVYDKTHLTAAHPTMPLPSYARVTNKKNGSSVIVRVNDRGPFAKGRVIDLSQRAAEMLDYKNSGVAEVAVEYVGRAPLHGLDDQYLMASYRPGGAAPSPSDGLPTGVMIAMNGSTPTSPVTSAAPMPQAAPFPGQLTATPAADGHIVLPDIVPIAPARPSPTLASVGGGFDGLLAYAEERAGGAAALQSFAAHRLNSEAIVASYARSTASGTGAPAFVAAGTFASKAKALAVAAQFASLADAAIEADPLDEWFAVSVEENGGASLDQILRHAWTHGAPDAMIVRD
ncbi:septal ring lytic transglycosylase RlpA family protein [Aliihoeflea sp. 2WW]|uniref:septal ring lytic transglycosylase RlpA family protein n=1 Tax=Aliihoeflea sp. 2WW TaxID=1381123 RepID=UPI0004634A76|nr:septal ring lytic transglycosylase RlpA family protein [Aliihoeflea sp. 2WW]